MRNQQQQQALSKDIVKAYRAWFHELEQVEAGKGRTVFMDDLSGVPNDSDNKIAGNWKNVLRQVDDNQALYPAEFTRKIRESLVYIENENTVPSRPNVERSGGVFGKNIEDDIVSFSKMIASLEQDVAGEFPKFEGTSLEYTRHVASSGEAYIRSYCPSLKSMEYSIEEMPSNALFLAQVVTNNQGNIVCQLMSQTPVGQVLAYICVHEILGHVLHFTQLKHSSIATESPHLLVLSLHTHESFFIEGIAQILTYFLLVKSSWDFDGLKYTRLACLKHMKLLAILHLVTTEIIDGKIAFDDAVRRHLEIDPAANQTFIKSRYDSTFQDFYSVKALLNYYSSFQAVYPLASLKEPDFFRILPELLTTYFTPESLEKFVFEKCESAKKV